jgi:hypothetical protein
MVCAQWGERNKPAILTNLGDSISLLPAPVFIPIALISKISGIHADAATSRVMVEYPR